MTRPAIKCVRTVVDDKRWRQLFTDGFNVIRIARHNHPAVQHLALNRHFVDCGNGVLVSQQDNRRRFVLMALQRTGEVESRKIAVNQRNIHHRSQMIDKFHAHIKCGWPRGLKVIHRSLTIFHQPLRHRHAALKMAGQIVNQLRIHHMR
ncbi:hypothetical protein D3C85_1277560 [compost metagenome]